MWIAVGRVVCSVSFSNDRSYFSCLFSFPPPLTLIYALLVLWVTFYTIIKYGDKENVRYYLYMRIRKQPLRQKVKDNLYKVLNVQYTS